jgi:hypothetical protein
MEKRKGRWTSRTSGEWESEELKRGIMAFKVKNGGKEGGREGGMNKYVMSRDLGGRRVTTPFSPPLLYPSSRALYRAVCRENRSSVLFFYWSGQRRT